MDIWVLTAWDTAGELCNEVMSVLFEEELVMPKVAELFEADAMILTRSPRMALSL